MKPEQRIESLLNRALKGIVLQPNMAQVRVNKITRMAIVSMRVDDSDVSRAIGRAGSNFKAFRALANLLGTKEGWQMEMEPIPEPQQHREQDRDGVANPRTTLEEIRTLVLDIARAVFEQESVIDVRQPFPNALNVLVSRSEDPHLVQEFHAHLSTIVKAMGKANGERIVMDITEGQEPEPPQPTSADGRHAKA